VAARVASLAASHNAVLDVVTSRDEFKSKRASTARDVPAIWQERLAALEIELMEVALEAADGRVAANVGRRAEAALALLARLMLWSPRRSAEERRAGESQYEHGKSKVPALRLRFALAGQGKFGELLDNFLRFGAADPAQRSKAAPARLDSSAKSNAFCRLVQAGRPGAGMALVTSSGIAEDCAATAAQLERLIIPIGGNEAQQSAALAAMRPTCPSVTGGLSDFRSYVQSRNVRQLVGVIARCVGAGLSGWRGEALLTLRTIPDDADNEEVGASSWAADVLRRFIVASTAGKLPLLAHLLGGFMLTPLRKKDPAKVRPIGSGEPLVKLVDGAWLRFFRHDPGLRRRLRPHQYACNVKAGLECLGHELVLDIATAPGNVVLKRDAENFFNKLRRGYLIEVAFALNHAFGSYVQLKLQEATEYTWFTATSAEGFTDYRTLTGTVQGGSLGFLLGSLATADPLRAWAAVMRSACGASVPGSETLADIEADPSFNPEVLAAARRWQNENAADLRRFADFHSALGTSPPTSLRAYADDQTTHVHPSGREMTERLQDAVYAPSGTVFGDKREVHVPAADPSAGLIVAGQPLWHAPGLAGGGDEGAELRFGVGPDDWLRANCLKPAQTALAESLAGLQEVWDNRVRGRPTLVCVLAALRQCVRQRFTHYARWFPPHLAREVLSMALHGIAAFVRYVAGWSDLHFYSDDHAAALLLELAQPMRDGGPAVAPWPEIAEPAYVAAWLDSAALIAQDRGCAARAVLVEWDRRGTGPSATAPLRHLALCLRSLPEPADSLCALWDRHVTEGADGELPRWQKCLSAALWPRLAADRRAATEKLPRAVGKRERKRLSAKACPGAARWLSVVPVYRYEYLEDQEARDWFSWWMGVPLEAIRSTLRPAASAAECVRRQCHLANCRHVRCSGEWRGFEDHVWGKCACARGFIHDCAVQVLAKEMRKPPLKMPVATETWEPSFPPTRRPGEEEGDGEDGPDARLDIRIELLNDATVVVDYSLVGASNLSAPAAAATLFASAQRLKHRRYQEYDAATGRRTTNLKVRPFIQSTFGPFGPEAAALLRDIRSESKCSTRALEDRLAVFLARAVARRLRRAYGAYSVESPESASWWPDLPRPGPGPPDVAGPDDRSPGGPPGGRAPYSSLISPDKRSPSNGKKKAEEEKEQREEVKETGDPHPGCRSNLRGGQSRNGKGLPCSRERAQNGKTGSPTRKSYGSQEKEANGLPCSGERAQNGKNGTGSPTRKSHGSRAMGKLGKGLSCSGERAQGDGKADRCIPALEYRLECRKGMGTLDPGAAQKRMPPRRGGLSPEKTAACVSKYCHRELRPERGKPGGIYGPDGAKLPESVFYRLSKKRYQARARGVDGGPHKTLEAAVAAVAQLRAA
jgi:hypothetical protein